LEDAGGEGEGVVVVVVVDGAGVEVAVKVLVDRCNPPLFPTIFRTPLF
jgi:hypothetical protein